MGCLERRHWRRCLEIKNESERKQFLHRLFAARLKRHGARYVIPLELWKGNQHVYTLYFATGSAKGCDLMKKSIWKVDPSGGFLRFAATRPAKRRCSGPTRSLSRIN